MKKRLSALAMALVLCLSFLVLPAAAAETSVSGAYSGGVVTVTGAGFAANQRYSMIAVKDGGGNLVAFGGATADENGALSASITTGKIEDLTGYTVYVYNNQGGTLAAQGAVTGSGAVTGFTITFDANGGTVTPAYAVTDAAGHLASLPTPVRSNYTFNGWFTAATGGTQVTAATVFTANVTVYAHWSSGGGTGGGGGGGGGGGTGGGTVTGSGSNVSVSTGSSVSESALTDAADKATAGSTVTINASGSSSVSLPVSGLKALADNNNNSITLNLSNGSVTLSAEALEGLAAGRSGGTVAVSIQARSSSSNSAVKTLLAAGAKVFDVSVTGGGSSVHSFDGSLTITLTVSALNNMKNPVVVHVLDNGGQETYTPSVSGSQLTIHGVRSLSSFAVIEADKVPGAEKPAVSFADVPAGAYYYDAVAWAVEQGITGGVSDNAFAPGAGCTRAQVVTFLWRASGSPAASVGGGFTDVPTGAYYADAVAWAVERGITGGTSASTFSPNAVCTRAQVVTFLHRAQGSPAASGVSFSDVDGGAYYAQAVAWAVAQGVTSGVTADTFAPNATCTRAQVVTFLYRALAS